MANIYKNILLGMLVLVLLIPLIQNIFTLTKEEPLKGAYAKVEPAEATRENWMERTYQEAMEKVIDRQFGFRDRLVRLDNQLNYSLFGIINVVDVYKGKNDFLYSVNFTRNYTGKDYKGDAHVDSVVIKLGKINKWLRSKNKRLLVCIAPCKESYVPEFLHDSIKGWMSEKNYYKSYIGRYRNAGIPVLDYHNYFQKMKDTISYPLFVGGAVHWTAYGAGLALDTMLKRIAFETGKNVNTVRLGNLEISTEPRKDDNDIYDAMNLLREPRHDRYAYPALHFNLPDSAAYKPKVLIIGDSFFYGLNNTWIPLAAFSKESYFLYYFKNGLAFNNTPDTPVDQMDMMKEIEDTDIIILFGSIGTMDIFPYGFGDFVYPKL